MSIVDIPAPDPTPEEIEEAEKASEQELIRRRVQQLRVDDAARREFAAEQYAARVSGGSHARALTGAAFIFEVGVGVDPIWGVGDSVWWSDGEGLLIVADDGVGKTLTAQQLILARLDMASHIWGSPVRPAEGRVLYLAMDRPKQAARSWRRMVDDDVPTRKYLKDQLSVWQGPLPIDPLQSPHALADWISDQFGDDVSDVVADSLKDMAPGLSEDATGSRLNQAVQEVISRGLQWVGLHHQRKAQSGESRAPSSLADVYGSRWITAGMGSVVFLSGRAGDPTVEALHLKQPMKSCGPLLLKHDHTIGDTNVVTAHNTVRGVLAKRGEAGATVRELSREVYGEANDQTQKRVRRGLRRLRDEDQAYEVKSDTAGRPARWFLGAPDD